MNLRTVAALTGLLVALVALMMAAPLVLAIYDGDAHAALGYSTAMAATALVGLILRRWGGKESTDIHRKDALGVVALTWLCLGIFGGLPFLIEGSIHNVPAAVFEAVSGFTTTGATVVADVDALSRATNLWRCQMHWFGGMGIVVLFVAVFPQLGVGAKHLFRTEVPGPITEGLRPRIKQTALALWWIYAGLTVLATVMLMVAGLPVYDAVVHAMSTLGTGGFSSRGASIGAYDNAAVEWIVILFMLLAGLNFGLYYGILRGRWRDFFSNYELRFYLLVNAVIIAVVAFSILRMHPAPGDSLRHAAFQTLAVTTTTGFMTEDFEQYPNAARYLLFLAMFMGGCAGSTAGGIKASRVYVLFKVALRELRSLLNPNVVSSVRLGNTTIPASVTWGIVVFVTTYFMIFAFASLILVAEGLDLLTAMSAVVACLSSVGPGLADVGPTQNFGFVPGSGKLLLSFCMIAGRLEIFALFAVFSPECWRR
ncbi:MAG: TrkH family potassium uptake protein [Myxococcota bacterium]